MITCNGKLFYLSSFTYFAEFGLSIYIGPLALRSLGMCQKFKEQSHKTPNMILHFFLNIITLMSSSHIRKREHNSWKRWFLIFFWHHFFLLWSCNLLCPNYNNCKVLFFLNCQEIEFLLWKVESVTVKLIEWVFCSSEMFTFGRMQKIGLFEYGKWNKLFEIA